MKYNLLHRDGSWTCALVFLTVTVMPQIPCCHSQSHICWEKYDLEQIKQGSSQQVAAKQEGSTLSFWHLFWRWVFGEIWCPQNLTWEKVECFQTRQNKTVTQWMIFFRPLSLILRWNLAGSHWYTLAISISQLLTALLCVANLWWTESMLVYMATRQCSSSGRLLDLCTGSGIGTGFGMKPHTMWLHQLFNIY